MFTEHWLVCYEELSNVICGATSFLDTPVFRKAAIILQPSFVRFSSCWYLVTTSLMLPAEEIEKQNRRAMYIVHVITTLLKCFNMCDSSWHAKAIQTAHRVWWIILHSWRVGLLNVGVSSMGYCARDLKIFVLLVFYVLTE